ncbi:hypothetical protein BN2476_230291 [Paraburkholderia piptadeniae]|uniref:Secreted protein n=1 Tax=Paraburkholderia piptadeniae TaxID=1701573 RepID=A0A1N7RXQ0_9BURK|nr:hypothetical protein BN2476_230291 [Paraburkholderia piptadeniae]
MIVYCVFIIACSSNRLACPTFSAFRTAGHKNGLNVRIDVYVIVNLNKAQPAPHDAHGLRLTDAARGRRRTPPR